MEDHVEKSGLTGVGFLAGLIALFLLVASLKATGHIQMAGGLGLMGAVLLGGLTARFLLRRWRAAVREEDFHRDGDVQFALAVFILVVIAPAVLVAASKPVYIMLLPAAAIPAQMFVRRLRHHR